MEFDLVVRNGLIVDGSGAPAFRGDVGVADGRIVALGELSGKALEEIDADGLVVAPGFVDGHTHMDAQVFWDELGSSTCWQGVTTAVMGNCGYTLAPARSSDRGLVARNIERAEDIPSEALTNAVPWNWSHFAEYLDVLDALPKGLNVGQSIGHSTLRIWAMGERAYDGPATEDDMVEMRRELSAALKAGALGLTTSSSKSHLTADGRPVASRFSSWDEVQSLVGLMASESGGTFQIGGTEEALDGRLRDLAVATGVPILMSVGSYGRLLRLVEEAVAAGGQMYGLTHCRPPICTLQSFRTQISFDFLGEGTWRDVRSRPLEEQRTLLSDPDVRARLVREARDGEYKPASQGDPFEPDFDFIWVMYSQYLPNPTLAEEARRRGVDPVEAMIDIALEHDFDIFFLQGFNQPPGEDEILEVLRSPHTAMTFSDSGAHVSQVADSSIPTHLLAYWVRERQAFTLEQAVRMITHQPASAWGLHDRGLLARGYAADITIFDPDTVAPLAPRVVSDVPGGSRRLEQRAQGYKATIVNGEVFTRDGEATAARAGRLLRAGQMHIPAGRTMDYTQLYIDGRWVDPSGQGRLDVIDSATEKVIATVPDGVAADVDRAVAAAKRTFASWSRWAPADRSKLLRRVSDGLAARREEIAEIESREIGMPRSQTDPFQVGMGIRAFTTAADVLDAFEFEDHDAGLVVREPIGVVGAITPWNFPLYQIGAKVAYALAAGCTVVLKPSELAPVSSFILAEILHEAGLPAGAFNLVTGLGPVAGEALAAHPDVDMITFTGSTRTGQRVAALANQTIKRVALELGGKSPNVILDDADLAKAVPAGVSAAYTNCGQTCSALTRMIVPRSRLSEVEELARTAAEAFVVGDPFVDGTRLGPLISAAQRDRVRDYINKGIDEGATLITGGPDAPAGLEQGYYVRPTVFSHVRNDMTIAREEIFGPVLSIIPYETEQEAIDLANDTVYGLAAAVWGSPERAQRVARQIRAGQVRINGVPPPAGAPFGGYKQSGLGREHGRYGFEEFLEVKAISS